MLNVLHTALGKQGKAVVRHVMNPKALERSKLLGKMDNDTREWTDGVLTAAARQVQRELTTTHTWIISDGDVDPEWIESLNSSVFLLFLLRDTPCARCIREGRSRPRSLLIVFLAVCVFCAAACSTTTTC